MKKYTCIVADDQEEAIDLIKDHIELIPQLELLYSSTNPVEALAFLDKEKPDIMFLDIHMPGLTGIDLVENMKERWGLNIPQVVFTTGHIDYTLNGYELGIADYILKPVTFKRFKKSVDRIINDLNKVNAVELELDFFFAEIDGKKVKINFSDILYIEGARNYIIVFTTQGRRIIYSSMSAIMQTLPVNQFMRAHKSYIVAINRVEAVRGNELFINNNGEKVKIPVGITYKKEVLKTLNIG